MCRSAGSSRAFTLAEVLLALFVVSVALLGLITVKAYAARARTLSRERLTAANLAVSLMTQVENRLLDGLEEFAVQYDYSRREIPDHPGYMYAMDDSYAADSQGPQQTLKLITLTVYYPDENGLTLREYPLWTMVHRRKN